VILDAEKLHYLRKADKKLLGVPVRRVRGENRSVRALPDDFEQVQVPGLQAGRALNR